MSGNRQKQVSLQFVLIGTNQLTKSSLLMDAQVTPDDIYKALKQVFQEAAKGTLRTGLRYRDSQNMEVSLSL